MLAQHRLKMHLSDCFKRRAAIRYQPAASGILRLCLTCLFADDGNIIVSPDVIYLRRCQPIVQLTFPLIAGILQGGYIERPSIMIFLIRLCIFFSLLPHPKRCDNVAPFHIEMRLRCSFARWV